MNSLNKERLSALLDGIVDAGECALVHEAALMVWGIDNNLAPYAIDVLVSKKTYTRLAETRKARVDEYMGNHYVQFESSYVPIRAWSSVGDGMSFASGRLIDCANVGYRCLRPELALEALPSSPDFQFLLEQRAALAEVLYFDDMTNEQLMEFRSFVRSV